MQGEAHATLAAVVQAAAARRYASPEAERLHRAAMAYRLRTDDALERYTAVVRQRLGAGLRMPLKDRTLYRAEATSRVFWWRDGRTVIQLLGLREQTPAGVKKGVTHLGLLDQTYDPLNDALLFGLVRPEEADEARDGDDFHFEHPLVDRWAPGYTFRIGDTVAVALPDGSRLNVVELQVVPRVADVHRLTGSLWIEPEDGALVRAVYRLARPLDAFRDISELAEEEDEELRFIPGFLKPLTFDLSLVAVEYGLWDREVWLPRSLRAEGTARAGVVTAPGALDVTYELEEVVTRTASEEILRQGGDPMEPGVTGESLPVEYVVDGGWSRQRGPRGRRTIRYLVPRDPTVLASSPLLPPPVWDDAPGAITRDELEELGRGLADLPAAPGQMSTPWTFRWGLQRTDLMRYNRVEGVSVGARVQAYPATPVGPLSATATVRFGSEDRVPNVRLDVARETLRRRVTLSGYHELAAVDEDARHLGLGNSVTALILGRDDGEYYRRTGGALEVRPPSSERRSYRLRAFAERHERVGVHTAFALGHVGSGSWDFRPNLAAQEGWDVGEAVTLTPWWGTDPRRAQGGLDLGFQVGHGTWRYRVATAGASVALPLPGDFRIAAEAAGGTSWGETPRQRWFYLGGASTLRGYEPVAMTGTSYGRVRGEVARLFSFGAVSLFSDGGWAGTRDDVDLGEALWSAGVGLSLVDGLIRADAAWGLSDPRGFRLELYLDGIL